MIREIAKEIFPPDIKPVARWRLAMFGIVMLLLFHVAWACGWVPGMRGFALADDMDALGAKVDTILVLSLQQRMRDLQAEICTAATERTRSTLAQEQANLQNEHRKITGQFYPLVSCT